MASRNLFIEERSKIVVWHEEGLNISQIANKLGMTRNTVRRWIRRYEEEGHLKHRSRGREPQYKIGEDEAKEMLATYKEQPFTPKSVFAQKFDCSVWTVRRALEREKNRKPAKKTMRATARRWINRNEAEGSLADRPRPHPPRKKKPEVEAQNATETPAPGTEPQASKKKKTTTTTTTPSRTSTRSKKQPTTKTPDEQSGTGNDLPKSTEIQESQPTNTNKKNGTKNNSKNGTRAPNNQQTAEITPDKLIGKDDKLPETIKSKETNNSDNNNISNGTTEPSDNRRGKKRPADGKLPEAEALIANVYKFLEAEYEFLKYYIGDICDLSPLINVLKRTADACGVDKYTVRLIMDKAQSQQDQRVPGAAKLAKFRQKVRQVSSLAEEVSSCDESEIEDEVQDNKQTDDDSKIKLEEFSSSDSEDEPLDNDEVIEESEDSDECEVEAPNMEIDNYETTPLDPLQTEPVEVKMETTDVENTQSLDPAATQPIKVKTGTTDIVNTQSDVIPMPLTSRSNVISMPLTSRSDVVPVALTFSSDVIPMTLTSRSDVMPMTLTSRSDVMPMTLTSRSDVIPMTLTSRSDVIPTTSLAPIKTEPDDRSTNRSSSDVIPLTLTSRSDVIPPTSLAPVKTEPDDMNTHRSSSDVMPLTTLALIKTESDDMNTQRSSSDVIPMTSLAPIRTVPDNINTQSNIACTSNIVCNTTTSEAPILYYILQNEVTPAVCAFRPFEPLNRF